MAAPIVNDPTICSRVSVTGACRVDVINISDLEFQWVDFVGEWN